MYAHHNTKSAKYCTKPYSVPIYTAPGPVSNIMVMPNENGTAANITWTAPPLSDDNTEVNYTVMVQGPSGTVVFMETTSGTAVSVTQGLGTFYVHRQDAQYE